MAEGEPTDSANLKPGMRNPMGLAVLSSRIFLAFPTAVCASVCHRFLFHHFLQIKKKKKKKGPRGGRDNARSLHEHGTKPTGVFLAALLSVNRLPLLFWEAWPTKATRSVWNHPPHHEKGRGTFLQCIAKPDTRNPVCPTTGLSQTDDRREAASPGH